MTRREQQELLDKGLLLPLMEEFYTIQGEGFHKGITPTNSNRKDC